MSKFEERDNSGALFRVTEKKGDKFPDYEGKAIVDGKPVWLSAWIKEGKRGKFMSLSFKERDPNAPGKTTNRARNDDDDLPPF